MLRKTPRAESRPDERSLGTKIIIRRVSERNLNEFEIPLKNGETVLCKYENMLKFEVIGHILELK